MNGEIIIYDEDDNYDYKRIKIGNGTDNVNDLDFIVNKEDIPAAAAECTHGDIYYKKAMIDNKDKAINKKIIDISKTITEQNIDTAFNDIFGGE